MPTVVVNGTSLACDDVCPRDGTPLAFAHNLVFTCRNLDDSGSGPRQVLSMLKPLPDWDTALEYEADLPEIDSCRIAIWGNALGAGHAIAVAAKHPEPRAAVAQCPFTYGLASAAVLGMRESLVLFGSMTRDFLAAASGKDPVCIPVVAAPGRSGLMIAPDALPGNSALLPDGHPWINQAAARSVLSLLRYGPGGATKRVVAPILICISENDSVAPTATAVRYANQAPQGDVRLYNAGHFDFYPSAALKQLLADLTAFLVSHLHPALAWAHKRKTAPTTTNRMAG